MKLVYLAGSSHIPTNIRGNWRTNSVDLDGGAVTGGTRGASLFVKIGEL